MPNENEPAESNDKPRSTLLTTMGVVLILLSGLCFFTLLSVPLFPLATGQRAMLGGVLFIGVQAFWWIGVALVGPAAVNKARDFFRR